MRKLVFLLLSVLILAGSCKYFRKAPETELDVPETDSLQSDEPIVDSASYYMPADDEEVVTAEPVSQETAAKVGTYYMIVGCFTVQQNADNYAGKLRNMGYNTQIIPGRDNFKMVTVKTYSSYKESVADIDKFRNEVTPNAWVYLKR